MQKVWEIDRVGDEPLIRPAEPRIAEDGTLCFHDFGKNISYILDSDGKLVGTFAAQGDSLGNVSRYINCFTTGNSIVIGAPDKLHFYTNQGKFFKAAPNNLFARFPLAFINENELLAAPGALTGVSGGTVGITHIDLGSGQERTFDEIPVTDAEAGGPPGAVVVGLTPQLKMAYDPVSGRLYYGKNSEFAIYIADRDGKRIKTFGLERSKTPITEDDKREHFAYLGMPKERIDKIIPNLPGELAYYHNIQVNNGLVYVFPVAGLDPRSTSQPIDIFSPDGVYLYHSEIRIDGNLHISGNANNLQIRDSLLYVILEDDAGKKTIVKYRISPPQHGE